MNRIIESFHKSCREHESFVAIEDSWGRKLTYESLSKKIEGLSNSINQLEGQIVAIQLPRSIEFVVALFATWQAKRIALILDPEWPPQRVRSCLERFNANGLVGSQGLQTLTHNDKPDELASTDSAYIILTSGTTGEPKGTVVSHEGIVNVLESQIQAFMLRSGSRCYWMHGVAFDASISDVGTALLSGATLVIDQELSYEKIHQRWALLGITHVDLPPALLPHIDPENAPDSLSVIIVGGQIADPASVRKWTERVLVINVYGPTEATICTSFVVCDSNWSKPLIGEPIKGITYTIDSNSGELIISGAGVALAYYGQPKLTEERFRINGGIRSFMSRDKVRRLEDGSIEFVGRLDRQFKLHGRLICPEEIESVIGSMPEVSQSYVQVHPSHANLVAWVETKHSTKEEILEHLSSSLPDWMVPSELRIAQAFPVSKSGKIDTECLSRSLQLDDYGRVTRDFSHLSPTEAKISGIFRKALEYQITELETPFDQLGIDSMSVVQILVEAEKLGISLSAQSLKKWPTVRELAGAIDAGLLEDEGKFTDELIKHIETLLPETKSPLARSGKPKHVLLTGATGFFGSALLGSLIQRDAELQVTCLVRGGDRSRVENAMEKHGFLASHNFQCLDGDIELEMFGLSDEAWSRLSIEVDAVVHCAAKVNLVDSFESCFSANVRGTYNVLQFCRFECAKSLHYISTLSVFVDAWPLPSLCLETDELNDTQIVYGGYAQSKWAAERLVRGSCPNNSVSIYRLGLLAENSSTGHTPANDLFYEFINDHSFEEKNRQSLKCDFTPVDAAAIQVTTLILNQRSGTWHICNPRQMSYDQLKEKYAKSRPSTAIAGISELALATGSSPFRVFKTTNTSFSVELTERVLSSAENS